MFGAQQNAPGSRIARTIGIVRARAKIGLQNLAYNTLFAHGTPSAALQFAVAGIESQHAVGRRIEVVAARDRVHRYGPMISEATERSSSARSIFDFVALGLCDG